MNNYKFSKNRQKGSALLVVMMMVILLTIMIMEISFSSQTAYSLAKNQIEKAQMNAVSESAFAYALNMIQVKDNKDKQASVTNGQNNAQTVENTNKTSTDNQSNLTGGNGLFSRAAEMDFQPDQLALGPLWKSDFPIVTIGKIQMKLKISLEESKLNINRLVNSEDKVDIRFRSALIEIFKKFEGTEEDVDRMIDYIDTNQLGQYEDGALNAPAQTLGELLRLPNLSVKYSLNQDKKDGVDLTTPQQQSEKSKEENMTLSDFVTVKSTGRININFASEDILKNVINNPAEKQILDTIINSRVNEPFKTLSQLSLNKTFGTAFKKIANYLTVDENTFKVKVIVRSKSSFKSRIYIGYIYKSQDSAHYTMRTERTYNNDLELIHDNDEMPEIEEEASDENLEEETPKRNTNKEIENVEK